MLLGLEPEDYATGIAKSVGGGVAGDMDRFVIQVCDANCDVPVNGYVQTASNCEGESIVVSDGTREIF